MVSSPKTLAMKMLRKIKIKALLFRRHQQHSCKYQRLRSNGAAAAAGSSNNPLKALWSKLTPFGCMRPAACSSEEPLKKKLKKTAASAATAAAGGCCSVPKGTCAVYVGPEHKRFVMKTCYLEHPVFGVLLQKSVEEFGYDYNGGLLIPCPVGVFEYLLRLLKRKDPSIENVEVTKLIQSTCS